MSETPRVLGGRYEVGALLGRGGMAEVHRGYDTRLGRPVAVKLLRLDLVRDHTFLTRFRREAQAAAGLNHPAIVAVYDSGEDTVHDAGGAEIPLPYIVMELVEGETLRQQLNTHGRLEPGEAARVTIGVLEALAYSHRNGIIHRDIKPGNVMVTKTGAVKVMDFGIARAIADSAATMTQTSAVVGTAQYLSPEQAQGQPVDARSDLYSTGCMLFELLTGRPPYLGESPVSIAYQHVGEPVPVPSHYNPLVPPSLDTVVGRALVKDRNERYQSAQDFRNDLLAAREGRTLSDHAALLASGGAHTEAIPAPAVADPTQVVPVASPQPTPAPVDPYPPERRFTTLDERMPAPVEERRRGRGALIVLLTLLIAAALGGIVYLVVNNQTRPAEPVKVLVPSVERLTESDARATLQDKKLVMRIGGTVADAAIAKGSVVTQDPKPGAQRVEGDTVTVTLSDGPALLSMPDLTDKTKADVDKILADNKFTLPVIVKNEDVPKKAKDVVAAQTPSPGTMINPATQSVTITVASGNVKVPSYVGKSEVLALVNLGDTLGLTVKTEDVFTKDSASGTVLEQTPKDVAVPIGSTVVLKIARTPQSTVTIPPSTPPTSPTTTKTTPPAP